MPANDTQVGGSHYKQAIQPWDAMKVWLTPQQFDGFLIGNAIKYLSRLNATAPGKGGAQDVRKAAHYLQKFLEIKDGARPNISYEADPRIAPMRSDADVTAAIAAALREGRTQ